MGNLFFVLCFGETILTIVSGKLETLITGNIGDIIIRNIEIGSSAETYIISEEIFKKRYEVVPEKEYLIDGQHWNEAIAKGEVEAFCYIYSGNEEETIQFVAPWGELMICNSGDFIARPVPTDNQFDIYRIEKDTFKMTYSKKE